MFGFIFQKSRKKHVLRLTFSKTQGKNSKTQGKNSKLKEKTQFFGIFRILRCEKDVRKKPGFLEQKEIKKLRDWLDLMRTGELRTRGTRVEQTDRIRSALPRRQFKTRNRFSPTSESHLWTSLRQVWKNSV